MKQKRLVAFLLTLLLAIGLTLPVSARPCYETPGDGCDTLHDLIAQSGDPNALFEVEVVFKHYKKETLTKYTQQASQAVQKEIDALLGENYNYAALENYNITKENRAVFHTLIQEYVNTAIGEVLTACGGTMEQITSIFVLTHFYFAQIYGWFTPEQIEIIGSCPQVRGIRARSCDYCAAGYDQADNPDVRFINTVGKFHTDALVGNYLYPSCIRLFYDYTATDALRMLQIAVGKTPPQPEGVCPFVNDPDKNKTINAKDALLALQHAVGKKVVEFSYTDLFIDGE